MRTIETKLFTFDELSEESKQVAIENHRQLNTEMFDWYQPIIEGYMESVPNEGFEIRNIYFSGFWSQGDGAMFTYSDFNDNIVKQFIDTLDVDKATRGTMLASFVASGRGQHTGYYSHSGCCSHSIYLESCAPYEDETTQLVDQYYDDFEQFVKNKYEELCDEIYSNLKKYYYELEEDDNVIEAIMANDFEFTEDGERY